MSIKLIATDLDGTLMSPDHLTITEKTKQALRLAHDKGVKIAIATGRPMALVDYVLKQVDFVDYVIYSNGACVFDRNKNEIVYSNLIDNKTSVELIKYFLEKDVFFEIYTQGASQFQKGKDKHFEAGVFPQEFIDEVIGTMVAHDDLLGFLGNEGIEKITFYSVKDEDYQDFKEKLEEYKLSVAVSFKDNLEATSPTADKGEALKGLALNMGIEPEEIMAFGDAGNDIPMLKFAQYSFAMSNGTEDCKANAKSVTLSNGEDAIAIEIEKLVLK